MTLQQRVSELDKAIRRLMDALAVHATVSQEEVNKRLKKAKEVLDGR